MLQKRFRAHRVISAFTFLAAILTGSVAPAQTIDWAPRKYSRTTLDGIYSEAQAARGLVAYQDNCSRCHRDSLFGGEQPLPLVQDRFMNRWREESLHPLLLAMKTMPKDKAPGELPENEYVDI